ncbi:MAG: hypothetical protein K1X92_08785 [Bacteroidia bacterium]|nr:hypothetical protein [Bacteroidia bacterium]
MSNPGFFKNIKGKALIQKFVYGAIVFILVLGALEGIYRYGIVDFYRAEWEMLNDSLTKAQLKKREQPIIHVFGDSFTANPLAWLTELKQAYPDTVFVNHAVPGTGIRQALSIARARIKTHDSDGMIYQIYTGNDLTDIRHVTHSPKLSLARKLYWESCNRITFPSLVNYRLGQFYSNVPKKPLDPPAENTDFSTHELQLIASEPDFIPNTVLLKNGREKDFKVLVSGLKTLMKTVKNNAPVYLIVLPHCTQVNSVYRESYQKRGAEFPEEGAFYQNDYPFITALEKEFRLMPSVKILNLLLPLKEAEEKDKITVYRTNDIHLNASGNKIVSDFLIKQIKTH